MAASSGAGGDNIRELLLGAPSSGVALQRQRRNLELFVADNADEFAALPYVPWTVATPGEEARTTMRASKLVSTLFGVYPVVPLRSNTLVTHYGGLLMSDSLFNRFHTLYSCPTGMQLPQLDFTDNLGQLIQMQIVGDPVLHGPNLMDGGLNSNCYISATIHSNAITQLANGKRQVSSSILQIHVKPGFSLLPGDELLFAYEGNGKNCFWTDELNRSEHCVICFGRIAPANNMFVQCEGANGRCNVSRHRLCMSQPISQASVDTGRYFCPSHIGAARMVAPSPSLSSSRPTSLMFTKPFSSPVQHGIGCSATSMTVDAAASAPNPTYFNRFSPPSYGVLGQSTIAPKSSAVSLASRLEAASRPSVRPQRTATQRTIQLAENKLADRPKHNLPLVTVSPRHHSSLQQVYDEHNSQQAFLMNCSYLSVKRSASTLFGAGDGMFLQQKKAKNRLVGYLFGHFLCKEAWSVMLAGRIPLDSGLPDSVLQRHFDLVQRGTYWCIEPEVAGGDTEEYVCLVSDQCPMGYINDPRNASQINVELRTPIDCVQSNQGQLDYTLLSLWSTRDIDAGEELLLDYGWTHADWRKSLAKAKKYDRVLSQSIATEESSSPNSSHSSNSSSDEASQATGMDAHRALGGHRTSATGIHHHKRSLLIVRSNAAVKLLPAFNEQFAAFGQMSKLQRDLLVKEVSIHRGKWFAGGRRPRIPNQTKRKQQAEQVGRIAAAHQVATNNKENWCDVDGISLDFVEYKSCCGSSSNITPLLKKLTSQQFQAHSSTSVLSMMKERLSVRAQNSSRDLFTSWIQIQLSNAVEGRVAWQGDTVCVSCFRALLGVSRSSIFTHRNKPDEQQRKQLTLTSSGSLRHSRSAPQLVVATSALRNYMENFGQSMPNPRSNNVNEEMVVLPAPGIAQLHEEVRKWDQSSHIGLIRPNYGVSTLARAIKHIYEENGIKLSISKSKMLCRCDDCDRLDNRIRAELDPAIKVALQTDKARHLKDVEEQRTHFNEQKNLALQDPLRLWCMTFDGMDQAKTQLPSRPRLSKALDPLPRLGLHAIGFFIFGAQDPVMGLINYPDLRKDSSLSVTSLENALNWQWLAMVQRAKEQRGAPPVAVDSADSATTSGSDSTDQFGSDDSNDEGHQDRADARTVGAAADQNISADLYKAVASRWPQRLHLTFDNATGEAKNQFMFRFLGLLVLNNVFQYITVSTLLVGHTHDIVDQMFSVWSRMLRVTSAATYEAMSKLFREKYHSRIKGLVALMRGAKPGDAAMVEATEAFGEEAMEQMLEARDAGNVDFVVSTTVASDLEKVAKELKIDAGVAPVIKLQTFSVNMKGWMEQAKERGATETILPNIGNPHIFGIEKDEAGDVYLYNSFLANSTDASYQGEKHHFLTQKTGRYSTRALLHSKANAQAFAFDPATLPAVRVEGNSLKETFNRFRTERAITHAEYKRLNKVLKLFRRREKKQSRCDICKELLDKLASIGTVSRKPTATLSEKRLALDKSNSRQLAQAQLERHLLKSHAELQKKTNGWWHKWLQRSEYIVESYVARGYMPAPGSMDAPYHLHPLQLCSGPGEQTLFDAHERIDLRWLAIHGKPKIGQYIVVRSMFPNEPFWIGVIRTVTGGNNCASMNCVPPLPLTHRFWGSILDEALLLRYAEVRKKEWGEFDTPPYEIRMSEAIPTPLHSKTQLGVFATRPLKTDDFVDFFSASMMDKDAVPLDESSHARQVSNVTLALDGGPLASCYTRYSASNNSGLVQMRQLVAADFLPRHLSEHQLQRFKMMPAGCMINSASQLDQLKANVKMTELLDLGPNLSHARVPKVTVIRPIKVGDELLCLYHSEEERSNNWQRADSDTEMVDVSAAAAAAPADLINEEAKEQFGTYKHGREHRADRDKTIVRIEEMPSVVVEWLDHHPQDYKDLKLEDEEYWKALHKKHGTIITPVVSAAAASASSGGAAAASASTAPIRSSSSNSSRAGLKPTWLVDMFQSTRFSEKSNADPSPLEPSSFIVWGDRATIFSKTWKLKSSTFAKVREDLTEIKSHEKIKSTKKKVNSKMHRSEGGKQKPKKRARRALVCSSSSPGSSSSSPSDSESIRPLRITASISRSNRPAAAAASKRIQSAIEREGNTESSEEDELEDDDDSPVNQLIAKASKSKAATARLKAATARSKAATARSSSSSVDSDDAPLTSFSRAVTNKATKATPAAAASSSASGRGRKRKEGRH